MSAFTFTIIVFRKFRLKHVSCLHYVLRQGKLTQQTHAHEQSDILWWKSVMNINTCSSQSTKFVQFFTESAPSICHIINCIFHHLTHFFFRSCFRLRREVYSMNCLLLSWFFFSFVWRHCRLVNQMQCYEQRATETQSLRQWCMKSSWSDLHFHRIFSNKRFTILLQWSTHRDVIYTHRNIVFRPKQQLVNDFREKKEEKPDDFCQYRRSYYFIFSRILNELSNWRNGVQTQVKQKSKGKV